MQRREPRTTWRQRWRAAGGKFPGGRMVALKTSPVWVNLSRFGNPWPPYDYSSGMGVMDIDRAEAERLGLLTPEQRLTPEPLPFPEVAEARLPGLEEMPELQEAVLKAFGPGASFEGDTLSLPRTPPISGATGTAKTLGLGSLRDSAVTPAPAHIPEQEGLALIESGQAVAQAPDGKQIRFTREVYDHWDDKPEERTRRMQRIRQAFAAVQEPQEVWERGGRNYYLKTFADGDRRQHMLVISDSDGKVETWIPAASLSKRKGTLLYKEGAR